ncbi:MAG: DNA mismatch repair protein MutS [SAR202 cluster bacterium Io17-Chloro-G9]|nr:MAG: DNA mismatch repair protein MutS [SAR202 cluster bacterium Io17-Chloro-G9]
MTPIRRQYLNIKHSYPDAILLFRLGDFYETFDDDARLASQELEITLTSRSMGKDLRVPMAGVPAHALDNYLARLIKAGHKVAICEQLSDPAVSKGLVDRDVVRVVTPGTVLESAILDHKANNYLAAVVEEGEWAGLAYVDVTTGEFAATQLESALLTLELGRISAAEVLSPESGQLPAWASSSGADGASGLHTTPLDPSWFGPDAARRTILDYYGVISLESFGCENMPLAIGAAGAIIDYLAQTQKAGAPQLSSLTTYSTASFMTLDTQTRRNLELFHAGRRDERQFSLFATLDQTRTPMGSRLLRRWLGQPELDVGELERRLDAVDLFFHDGFKRGDAMSLLAQIPDLERIMGRITARVVAPRELVALKRGLEAATGLEALLAGPAPAHDTGETPPDTPSSTQFDNTSNGTGPIGWLHRQITSLPQVVDLIQQSIAPEPAGDAGGGNVIREGFSPELDEVKRASREATTFIASLEHRERERTGIRGLKVGYNQVFGYYIEVSRTNSANVPDDYQRRQTLTNAERFTLPELKEYESLVLNAKERIEEMERDVYRRVCSQLAGHAAVIGKLAAAIAQVDVFTGLAEVAIRNGYVRPALDLEDTISIKDGRHPVVERVLDPGSFVANDVHLSNDGARMVVLTGPNMAGKSTYIRQVAIITLMAQIGSFVPAAEATIGLVDRIFTRVGLQDDLTTGQSTFMVEMLETAAILNQATPRSLVILDEIGRGTSTYDGLSIARSVIEHLHNDPRLGCKTLFATHFHELTELASTLPSLHNFSVAVTEEEGRVIFLHRIVPGGADRSYGVHVAQLAGLPRGVVNRAWEVLADMEKPDRPSKGAARGRSGRSQPMQVPLFSRGDALADEIKALDIPNLTPLEAINKLYELQQKATDQGPAD